jgi:hypothetical protein
MEPPRGQLAERGFNQALISGRIAAQPDGLPVADDARRKIAETPPDGRSANR